MLSNAILKLTKKSRHRHHHHSAQVRRGGAVVSVGYNHETRHAEVDALSKLWPSERVGTTVVSVRVTKGGTVGMAKPCENCLKYMMDNGVKKVVYTGRDGELVVERL
jgi:deoxycytidylate deaminase